MSIRVSWSDIVEFDLKIKISLYIEFLKYDENYSTKGWEEKAC